MWMRRRPSARTGYAPVYANSDALRSVAAGLSASAAAAVAAVAPDVVHMAVPQAVIPVPVVPVSETSVPAAPVPVAPVLVGGQYRLVRLGFSDDTSVDLDARDPWAIALTALAGELLATPAS